jgi:hypothetical protein
MANYDYEQLRQHIDSNDPFMTRGHQIIKIRRGWRKKQVPEWATNDKSVQALVLRSFPKLKTDDKQRRRAGIWVRVINLYFRMGWTRGQIAEELGTTSEIIKYTIRRIRRVSEGKAADGLGPRVKVGSGRPKNSAPTQTPLRDPHENHRKVGAGAFV